jgi:hypothetical protein
MTEQVVTYKGRTFSIVLLLIIGVLGILLWWKSCGSNDNVDLRIAKEVAKRTAKSVSDSIALEKKVKAVQDSLKELAGKKELSDSMLKDAANDLEKMFRANEKLRAQHAKTPAPIPFDSSNSIVSNEYLRICDTCFNWLQKLEDTVKSAKKLVEQREESNKKIISLKDEEVEAYKNSMVKIRSRYYELLDIFAKAAKSKASLSGGIESSYSPVNTNIGAYLTFRSKKGHEYGLSAGGNSLSSWYIGGRLGMKIF